MEFAATLPLCPRLGPAERKHSAAGWPYRCGADGPADADAEYQGGQQEHTLWHDVVAWCQRAVGAKKHVLDPGVCSSRVPGYGCDGKDNGRQLRKANEKPTKQAGPGKVPAQRCGRMPSIELAP